MKYPQLDFDIEELSNYTNDTFKVDFEINAIVETDDVIVCCIVWKSLFVSFKSKSFFLFVVRALVMVIMLY